MGTVHRQGAAAAGGMWEYSDVPTTEYRSEAAPGVIRRVLVGQEEGARDFIVRYFTVPAGGHTAFDQHEHQHGVVVVQGRGRVLIGEDWHEIAPGDAVFTDANEIHQFAAAGDVPLGFICVIPRWAEQ